MNSKWHAARLLVSAFVIADPLYTSINLWKIITKQGVGVTYRGNLSKNDARCRFLLYNSDGRALSSDAQLSLHF